MKKLLVGLICGCLWAPFSAWGQTWVEPYTDQDGIRVEGHWQTPEDLRKQKNSTPGRVNPYTGSVPGTSPASPTPPNPPPNPYYPQQDYGFQPKDYRYQGS
jgi:hypothetical protein